MLWSCRRSNPWERKDKGPVCFLLLEEPPASWLPQAVYCLALEEAGGGSRTHLWKTAEQSVHIEVWLSKGKSTSPSLQSSHTKPFAWHRCEKEEGKLVSYSANPSPSLDVPFT